MFRILIVGDDTDVVRASVRLLQIRYEVSMSSTLNLMKRISEVHYELLILCHTIPLPKAASLIQDVSEKCPWLGIVWLAQWQTIAPGRSESKIICIDGVVQPPWLEAVDKMAAQMGYRQRQFPRRRATLRVSS